MLFKINQKNKTKLGKNETFYGKTGLVFIVIENKYLTVETPHFNK